MASTKETSTKDKNIVHVEVCLSNQNKLQLDQLESKVEDNIKIYLSTNKEAIKFQQYLNVIDCDELEGVDGILVECEHPDMYMSFRQVDMNELVFHYYRPNLRAVETELFDENGESDAVPASSHWLLPSSTYVGLWENLVYEDDLKEKLLRYALSALRIAQYNVNPNIVVCNRLILLHGPPGTGKTSLCKALAQKLAIRTRSTFRNTHLIEINSHSLFSKWFSESGKLVMHLFNKLRELVADPKNLVCVLIDEVESLAYARDCMSGQEPKDAMRVVNALLTQLDNIREHPNILILATSNLVQTIDSAFLDRADISQYIGLPSVAAKHNICVSMIRELIRAGVVETIHECEIKSLALKLSNAAHSANLSGRALRKLPFLALTNVKSTKLENGKLDYAEFMYAMVKAITNYTDQKSMLEKFIKKN